MVVLQFLFSCAQKIDLLDICAPFSNTMKTISLTFFLAAMSMLTLAADMDARLNMAIRLLNEIDNGLSTLKSGDVSTYNALSKKLTKAADMLKNSESNQHPDYVPSTQRWNNFRQTMVETAQQWQTQQQNATSSAQNTQKSNNAPSNSQAHTQSQASSNSQYTVNADTILAKYQSDNLPTINDDSAIAELESWATSLAALQGDELRADLILLDSGSVNPKDANRVKRWISGDFQRQIDDRIRQQVDRTSGSIREAHMSATMILAIADDDEMRIFNFANGDNGLANLDRLNEGLRASEKLIILSKWFPDMVDSTLLQATADIGSAATRFAQMRDEASQTGEKLAKMPKKQRPKRPDFLKPIEQEIWLNGRYIGSLSTKGTVIIESKDVGSITSDGRIWVRGNDAGSIETNGEVWFMGNQLGSLEDNGEVWRNGTQVGLVEIDKGGAIWIGGSKDGELEPYSNEWKRAAIVYFFRDVFNDAY